jgi:hypothetical protein
MGCPLILSKIFKDLFIRSFYNAAWKKREFKDYMEISIGNSAHNIDRKRCFQYLIKPNLVDNWIAVVGPVSNL